MPTYKAPVDDVMFLLSDVFHIDRYNNLPGFADATPDLIEAVLAEAAKFCEDVLTPLNRVGDKEGCKRHGDGSVSTPTGFKDAYKRLTEGGWIGAAAPAEYGGQGLPVALSHAIGEFQCAANMAFAMYPGLTQGAAAAIAAHGSAEQKALYLPKLIAGEWTGTMNLTEPQCGTDLGLVRTRPSRRPTAPTRSPAPRFSSPPASTTSPTISCIWCWRASPARRKAPRAFRCSSCPNSSRPDGALGARNGVSCGSIEEKMGIHGNSTCVMNYDDATGWLIGEAEQGPQRHVRDDERGAARRRHAGAGACPRSPIRTR